MEPFHVRERNVARSTMTDPERDRSRVAANRVAMAIAVGSLVLAGALVALYWAGLIDFLLPEHRPAADAAPLYVLFVVVAIALVAWGWKRVFSLFR